MIDQVEQAMKQIQDLPAQQQREIAKLIQEEIQWESTLANTQDELSKLSGEAIQEYKHGKTSGKEW